MTRRSFMQLMIAIPVGLMTTHGPAFEWVEPAEGSQGFWERPDYPGLSGRPLAAKDIDSAFAEARERAIENYFAPNSMYERLNGPTGKA